MKSVIRAGRQERIVSGRLERILVIFWSYIRPSYWSNYNIRGGLTDGAHAEGWAVYLMEAMMHAGVLDDSPSVSDT